MPADRTSPSPGSGAVPSPGVPEDEWCASAGWSSGDIAEVAVHVPTYGRSEFLPMLVERLAAQTLARERFEVVVVDNGSRDDTWAVLRSLVERSPLRMAARRLPVNRGPAAARNAAVAASRAPILAFTDDDCLPEPGWLEALVAGTEGADLVQGRTEPDPAHPPTGAWDRTIRIAGPTSLFETCNIAYRRSAFVDAGGFDEASPISARPGGRAFGEDVLLGASVVSAGGRRAYAHDAVVHHRYLPGSFGDHVREMRNLAGFPALVRESPAVAAACWRGMFLTRRTAAFDLGVVGALAAATFRRPALALAAVPWIVQTLPLAHERGGRHPAIRLAQLALADAVGAASLIEGSVRHRRLLL